jgi:hypothetical protein
MPRAVRRNRWLGLAQLFGHGGDPFFQQQVIEDHQQIQIDVLEIHIEQYHCE